MWRDTFFRLEEPVSLPVKFTYDGKSSDEFLGNWFARSQHKSGNGWNETVLTFTEPGNSHLCVTARIKLYTDFPAADWVLEMENIGETDTAIVEKVRSVAMAFDIPDAGACIHKSKGGLSTLEDFVQEDVIVKDGDRFALYTQNGRSTNGDNAYFTLDTACGRVMAAIGWSGQWRCEFAGCEGKLSVEGGLEDCHFVLHPGEKIHLPSMVMLFWEGEPDRSYSAFRKLVLAQYAPALPGRDKRPYLFCNTCFTRGGGWLEECNEENQISLINALGNLDVEAVITDAGWYKGEDGEEKSSWVYVGNWEPSPKKYPRGFAPVAAAAKKHDMKYGLWFEPERVRPGTALYRQHPELLLKFPNEADGVVLVDFGKPETVAVLYGIVDQFLRIDNIKCYRQDFNCDPLTLWRANDTPDRQGMTEIKYINGLYNYLDLIRTNHPDVFMDGCASGGRRLDIEMIKRFHTHQKTDLWFKNTVDQNSLFSLAHYLPNSLFTAHVDRYDDYTFNTVMGATLCLGWIADGPEGVSVDGRAPYSHKRARALIDRYNRVRPYLNKDFYPLTSPSAANDAAIASQYIDEEAGAGVIMAYKREDNHDESLTVRMKAMEPAATYRLTDLTSGEQTERTGREMAAGLKLTWTDTPDSKVILFERQ